MQHMLSYTLDCGMHHRSSVRPTIMVGRSVGASFLQRTERVIPNILIFVRISECCDTHPPTHLP